MDFAKEQTRREAERFRTQLYIAHQQSEMTETEVAAILGIEQQTYSSYLAPGSARNLPAFFLPILPASIREHILEWVCNRAGGTFRKTTQPSDLNGSPEDEFLNIAQHLGDAIKRFKEDRKEALRVCLNRIEQEIQKAKAELDIQRSD